MNFLSQSSPLSPKKQRSGLGLSCQYHDPTTPPRPRLRPYDNSNPHQSSSPLANSISSPTKNASKTPPRSPIPDRFIPNRLSIDFDRCQHQLLAANNKENSEQLLAQPQSQDPSITNSSLLHKHLSPSTSTSRMLPFSSSLSSSSPPGPDMHTSLKRATPSCSPSSHHSSPKKRARRILPTAPSKILDAPGLRDDYYLNLLSWGSNNTVAVALAGSVFLWSASSGHIEHLLQLDDDDSYITSVQWSTSDSSISVGTSTNEVQIWDSEKLVKKRTLSGHTGRVSSLSWSNSHTLSSGGRDSTILNHDVRANRHVMSTYLGHEQEVCGLAWSSDGSTLASGGNENMMCIWDAAMSGGNTSRGSSGGSMGSRGGSMGSSSRGLSQSSSAPRLRMRQHQAAVKALAWCPWRRNVLASGGGTADRHIRLWNSATGGALGAVDTGSQVCALLWSESHRELLSSHGFSDNQLCLWSLPSPGSTSSLGLIKTGEFRSHTKRVLHMALSPDGSRVVSAGADNSLKFWDMFGGDGRGGQGSAGVATAMGNLGGGFGLR